MYLFRHLYDNLGDKSAPLKNVVMKISLIG